MGKTTRNIQSNTQVLIDGDRVLKVSEGFKNPLTHLFEVLKTDRKTPFYDAWNEKPLPFTQRTTMLSRTDTIESFDPETYELKSEIKNLDVQPDSIKQLRLLQTWYWDEKKCRLYICLDGVAPLVDVLDDFEDVRYSRPLFYRRGRR